MSQVVVTEDSLKILRERSRAQEHRIKKDDGVAKWRRSDITGADPVAKAIGFAVLPVLGLWLILGVIGAVMVEIVNGIFKVLGSVIGGTKSLITGE